MDLLNQIKETTTELHDEGFVKETLKTKLKKCVESTVEDMFNWNGIGKRAVEKAMEEALGDLKIELPRYNKFIAETIKDMYSNALTKERISIVEEQIKKDLNPIPKNMTSSAFWSELVACFRDDIAIDLPASVEVDVSEDRDSCRVKICAKDATWRNWTIIFYDHDKKGEWYIGYIEKDKRPVRHFIDSASPVTISGPMKYLFNHYCNGTIFELDEEDFYDIDHYDEW